jgi:pyrophosphatase PpaX
MAVIKAIVFDSDGTLIDGFSTIVDAYAHVAALHGRQAPTADEVKQQLSLARPLHDIFRTFFPADDVEQMVRENGEFIAANSVHMPSFEGLHQMLETLKEGGFKLAILTGGNHKVHDLFKYHNIEHYFTSIVHCDRVSRAKPDPEGFILAAEECGVSPAEMVMVGDSPNDIFAGKNAGAGFTVAITHGNGSREALEASDPDYLVNNLSELEQLILTEFKRA